MRKQNRSRWLTSRTTPVKSKMAIRKVSVLGGTIDFHPDIKPCAGCGCCCHLVVELRPGDLVPAEFVVEREGFPCMDQGGDGACTALDPTTRLCTIYEQRPQTCREFNRGDPLCRRLASALKPA